MTAPPTFSHLDPHGRAKMVDVSEKPVTRRVAAASCRVVLSRRAVLRLANLPKGDALVVARLAGIQAAKRTAELVPLAHPLPLDRVEVEFERRAARRRHPQPRRGDRAHRRRDGGDWSAARRRRSRSTTWSRRSSAAR